MIFRKVISADNEHYANKHIDKCFRYILLWKQRCTKGYKRYKETSGLIEWKECQIFHSIFT